MADCSRWKAGREKKSPPVVVAKERTGMVTVLVCNVVEVQRIETLSYDTGEKASGSILKLKVRVPSQEPTEVEANFSDGSDESEVVTSVGSDIDY